MLVSGDVASVAVSVSPYEKGLLMAKHTREEERGQPLDRINRALPVTRFVLWLFFQWLLNRHGDHF